MLGPREAPRFPRLPRVGTWSAVHADRWSSLGLTRREPLARPASHSRGRSRKSTWAGRQSSTFARSRRLSCSGSARSSISTILPASIVKTKTTRGLPPGAHTAPANPSTRASLAARARPKKVSATAAAPRTSLDAPTFHSDLVGTNRSVGVKKLDEGSEVDVPRCGEEGIHHLALDDAIGVGSGTLNLDPAAGPGWRAGVRLSGCAP